MNTPNNNIPASPARASAHPMLLIAALAVIVFCLVGTAAILGWLPSGVGSGKASGELSASDRAALASRMADADPAIRSNLLAANGTGSLDNGVNAERERVLAAERSRELDEREREREFAAEEARNAEQQRERDAAAAERRAEARRSEPVRVARAEPARPSCSNCGNVESVRTIRQRAEGSGLGAAGGAVLGGLLGNQVGGGSGRKIATVAGAVGGAVVGNQVEGNMKATTSYEVRVRLDNGTTRTFHLQNLNGFSSGDRIKVVNGALRHAR